MPNPLSNIIHSPFMIHSPFIIQQQVLILAKRPMHCSPNPPRHPRPVAPDRCLPWRRYRIHKRLPAGSRCAPRAAHDTWINSASWNTVTIDRYWISACVYIYNLKRTSIHVDVYIYMDLYGIPDITHKRCAGKATSSAPRFWLHLETWQTTLSTFPQPKLNTSINFHI